MVRITLKSNLLTRPLLLSERKSRVAFKRTVLNFI